MTSLLNAVLGDDEINFVAIVTVALVHTVTGTKSIYQHQITTGLGLFWPFWQVK